MFISVIFILGCGGFKVLVMDDPFKKTTIVKVNMWHKVVEGYLDNRLIVYEREINQGKKSLTNVSFTFYATSRFDGKKMEDKIYLLIDGKSFTLPINDIKDDTKTETGMHGVGGPVIHARTYNISQRYIYGKFQLTPEIEQAILNCKDYSMRVYMDTETTTLRATDNQLDSVKEFLMVGR